MGLAACLITCIILSACSNDMDKVRFFDQKEPPVEEIFNSHIDRSAYGRRQVHIESPHILQYGQPDQRSEYPQGVQLWFYNESDSLAAYVRAGYAVSHDNTQLTMLRDSVVIIDVSSGDTSYLQDLYWDANLHRIYSEHPVRSSNGNRVTYGDGFESDENFRNPLITHQRGTIEWYDDGDSTAVRPSSAAEEPSAAKPSKVSRPEPSKVVRPERKQPSKTPSKMPVRPASGQAKPFPGPGSNMKKI